MKDKIRRILRQAGAKELIVFLSNGPKSFKDIASKVIELKLLILTTVPRLLREMVNEGLIERKYPEGKADTYELTTEGRKKIISALEKEINELSELLEKIKEYPKI